MTRHRSTVGRASHEGASPGAVVKAFESAMHHGVCDGAILRARLNLSHPENTIDLHSWGYSNGYATRFVPLDHALAV